MEKIICRNQQNWCGSQVPAAHIQRLDLVSDIDHGLLNINVFGSQAAAGAPVQV